MGLLLIEKREWVADYQQMKSTAETAELARKHDHAAYLYALDEAKKREESLKKALEIEKESLCNVEKALHEMRAKCAEAKVAADTKIAETRSMMEDAMQKMTEANSKMQAAESLVAEASRHHQRREKEWAEMIAAIELKFETQKLKKETHADREGVAIDSSTKIGSPPLSAPFVWLKRCANSLLEQTRSNKRRKQNKDAKQSESISPRRVDGNFGIKVIWDKMIP